MNTFEQIAWTKDGFVHNWELYRPGGRLDRGIELKGYAILHPKTGRVIAWALLGGKPPSEIKEGHLRGGEGPWWTAKEVTYEEAEAWT